MGLRPSGFTVAEVVIVLVIIAIITAIAVPRYANALANHRADLAAARIVTDIEFAQRQAKFSSTSQTIAFHVATETYSLPGMPDLDRSGQDYLVRLGDEPYGADIVSVDLGGDAELVFDGYGLPDSGGSVVVSVGSRRRRIDIDPSTGQTTVTIADAVGDPLPEGETTVFE